MRGYGKYSNIITIDPQTLKYDILVEGSRYSFFSGVNGTHEITEYGTVLVTSSQQGRAFELDRNGEVVFDFVNVYDADANETLHLSETKFLKSDFFQFDEAPQCGRS